MSASTRDPVDVLVIGAGLTGLAAGNLLEQAGRTVRVLEAAGEVGGRTRSRLAAGRVVDVGGELVGRRYHLVRGLAHSLGLHLTPSASLPRLDLDANVRGALRPRGLASLWHVHRQLRELTDGLDPARPWAHPRASELDALTLADWLETTAGDEPARQLVETCVRAFATVTADRLSMLGFLLWLQPGGGLPALVQETRWRLREGAQEVSRRLATRLRSPVVLDCPVRTITQERDGLRVTATDGDTWRARDVAVCVPLAATGAITFEPALPDAQRRLLEDITVPPITKIVLLPAARKTRARVSIGDPMFPVASVGSHRGLGFAYGADANAPHGTLAMRLAGRLGLPAEDLAASLEQPWHLEPHVHGGYPAFAPRVITRHGPALRAAVGNIHFAGADRSTWPGTMEGAVRDAHRLAGQITATQQANIP